MWSESPDSLLICLFLRRITDVVIGLCGFTRSRAHITRPDSAEDFLRRQVIRLRPEVLSLPDELALRGGEIRVQLR